MDKITVELLDRLDKEHEKLIQPREFDKELRRLAKIGLTAEAELEELRTHLGLVGEGGVMRFVELEKELEKYRKALRYIARDQAALEIDCAHDQADMYVAKAKEVLYNIPMPSIDKDEE